MYTHVYVHVCLLLYTCNKHVSAAITTSAEVALASPTHHAAHTQATVHAVQYSYM